MRNPQPAARVLSIARRSAELQRLWPEWQALTRDAPPFLTPEFFWLNSRLAFGREPLLAVAHEEGRMTGALPLALEGRNLHTLRTEHTPRFDYHGSESGLAAIFEALTRDYRWDLFFLRHVPSASPLHRILPDIARKHFCLTAVEPGNRCPNFALPGFEENMDRKFRTNLLRCTRKLGGVRFERRTRYSFAELEAGFALEAMAWKGQAGTSINSDDRFKRFYRALARVFGPRGQLSLNFVYSGEQRVAFLIALEDGETLYALKPGYDPEFANVSPGHLIILETARDAEKRGLKLFDFMGPEAEWKRKWTDQAREHVHMVIHRPSPRGYAQYGYRRFKPHIPPAIISLLKRFKS